MTAERLPRAGQFFLPAGQVVNDRHGGLVAILAPDADGRTPTEDQIVQLVRARIHLVPARFRQVLVPTPLRLAGPMLVDDPGFDVARHVRVLDGAGGTEEGFAARLSQYMGEMLKPDRPLWEIALIPGLPDGRLALLIKLHHAIVEGEGALSSLGSLLFARGPTVDPGRAQSWQPQPAPGSWRRFQLAALDQARRTVGLAGGVARGIRTVLDPAQRQALRRALRDQLRPRQSPSLFNQAIRGATAHVVAEADLATLQAIAAKSAGGATLDDVILAAITGGLRAWLLARGLPAENFVVQMPVATERKGLAPRRVFTQMPSFMVLPLPVDEPSPRERLDRIARLAAERRLQAPAIADWLAPLAELPMPLYRRTAGWVYERLFHFHLASLRGPPIMPYVLGSQLQRAFIVFPVRGHHAIRWVVLVLGGKVTISFACDPTIVVEPERLAALIEESVAELHEGIGA
jgi:diacylglycerol O-acyltransferase / wax synthase